MIRPPLQSLQMLRGLAALLVVGFHVTEQFDSRFGAVFFWSAFRRGWCGVDLFFVLSGFIIGYIHGNDFGLAGQLRVYVIKRIIRIYPVYWCVLSVAIFIGFMLPQFGSDRERSLDVILRSWFLVPNRGLPVLGVAWTLCHEVYFYAVFGLMLALGRRWGWTLFCSWMAGCLVYGLGNPDFEWPLSATSQSIGFDFALRFLLNPLNLEFGFGVALAMGLAGGVNSGRRLLLLISGIGLILAGPLIAARLAPLLGPFLGRVMLYGGAATCVVAWGVAGDRSRGLRSVPESNSFLPRWTSIAARLLSTVGDASYSLYLVHYPLLVLGCVVSKRWLGRFPGVFSVLGVTMVVGVTIAGVIVHRVLERSLLDWSRRMLLPSVKLVRSS